MTLKKILIFPFQNFVKTESFAQTLFSAVNNLCKSYVTNFLIFSSRLLHQPNRWNCFKYSHDDLLNFFSFSDYGLYDENITP